MLTDAELEGLMVDLESELVERKESLSSPDRIREAICAYANDLSGHQRPGVIFVGVRNDGTCANLPITDDLLLRLAQMRDDGAIQPFPSMTVNQCVLHGCQVAVVQVQPSSAPPVRYNGRTWIRVGPRRAVATSEEERRLAERRRWGDLPFDIQPIPYAEMDELDLDFFQRDYLPRAVAADVLAQNNRSIEEQLQALRFLGPDGHPTVLGILVLGYDPRRYFPGAYIQFLRIEGTELTDPIRDQKEIAGPLAQQLRRLDDVLEVNNAVSTSITAGPLEIRYPEYPIPALQQLARNAVLHRAYEGTNAPVRIYWFSDRIEMHSPGGPFGNVNQRNFGQPGITDYRNPHLAEAMNVLGYVQRFGFGIPIARQELARNNNPAPEFTVESTHVLVTVRRRS